MTEFIIPPVPVIVLVLIQFFTPYLTAIPIDPKWSAATKKWVAIIVSVVVSALVLAFAFWLGEPIPSWPLLILIGLTVSQTSYGLVTKRSADSLAATTFATTK